MTTTVTRINLDGTVETQTVDTRTIKEKLDGKLTFKEKLDLMYPTSDLVDTSGWSQYDEHKFYK